MLLRKSLAGLVVVFLANSSAQALVITNGFETPGAGGTGVSVAVGNSGTYAGLSDFVISPANDSGFNTLGVLNPSVFGGGYPAAPEGVQYLFFNSNATGGFVFGDINLTIDATAIYSYSVEVGRDNTGTGTTVVGFTYNDPSDSIPTTNFGTNTYVGTTIPADSFVTATGVVTGAQLLTLDPDLGGNFSFFLFMANDGAFSQVFFDDVAITVVPEPSSLPMLLFGAIGTFFFKRKRG